jgi:signal peptidase I
MNFDFAIVLVILTGASGLIWLIDALFYQKARAAANAPLQEGQEAIKEPWLTEQSKSFFPVLLVILLVRSFWFEPFKIPSPSMVPTLLVGDFIVVNKYAYGIRIPILNKKIISVGDPQRGDVAVFKRPKRQFGMMEPKDKDPTGFTFIKRVIGLPGDTVRYEGNTLTVNGTVVGQAKLANYLWETPSNKPEQPGWCEFPELYNEQLSADVQHQMLDCGVDTLSGDWTVPAGHYLMMGDNRDNSSDSRDWGFVPEENLVGRASFIWFHFDYDRGGFVSWKRIGNKVK